MQGESLLPEHLRGSPIASALSEIAGDGMRLLADKFSSGVEAVIATVVADGTKDFREDVTPDEIMKCLEFHAHGVLHFGRGKVFKSELYTIYERIYGKSHKHFPSREGSKVEQRLNYRMNEIRKWLTNLPPDRRAKFETPAKRIVVSLRTEITLNRTRDLLRQAMTEPDRYKDIATVLRHIAQDDQRDMSEPDRRASPFKTDVIHALTPIDDLAKRVAPPPDPSNVPRES